MAGFCLHLTDVPNSQPTPQMSAAHAVMEKRGLTRSLGLSRTGFQLRYYGKILNTEDQVAKTESGDFALASGTFIYDNKYGEPALKALLQDFDPAWSCLTDATGQFALVVYKDGSLHLSTDHGGFYHIYRCCGSGFYSSSFLAACRSASSCTPVPMNIHERLVCGAIHADETVFAEIDRIGFRNALQLLPEPVLCPKPPLPFIPNNLGRRTPALERCAKQLVDVMRPLGSIWGEKMVTPLTGGYDSRLLTASLRVAGATPSHLVYGIDTDPDVVIGKAICRAFDWPMHHMDKSQFPDPSEDEFAELTMRSYHFHDGRGTSGIFDNGSDLESRWERGDGGRLYLNGSGGGLFRDALDIGRQRCTADHVVRSRYERFGRDCFHEEFSWDKLMEHAAGRMATLFKPATMDLDNWQIHALFPRWRLRYWMSPDNQDNNLIAPALVPYTDPRITELALALPQKWRNDGRFEADLIRTLSPELAAHVSSYGWRFDEAPPVMTRLRRQFKHATPGLLRRRWQRRVRQRSEIQHVLPRWLGPRYQQAVLGSGPLLMNEFIKVDAIKSTNERNLVLSLELLLRDVT